MRAVAILVLLLAPIAATSCPPAGWSTEALQQLRADGFEFADDGRRNALAMALVDCLSDPDPLLRDRIAYEALARWMRAGALAAETVRALQDRLLPVMAAAGEEADDAGFARPFAALVLAEVARLDRRQPVLDETERLRLATVAAASLRSLRDYRGFDPQSGWRHGVAHGADLALQLVLNPALGREAIDPLLDAIATQVAPRGAHFYVFGEPERLAMPVLYAAKRGAHDAAFWDAWFQQIGDPAPLPSWERAFDSLEGLAKRHNTRGFLLVLHVNARESGDPNVQALAEPAMEALKRLP